MSSATRVGVRWGLLDPADSPNAVTLFGSPLNPDTFFLTCLKFKLEQFQLYTQYGPI
jgi:hypothetical protein